MSPFILKALAYAKEAVADKNNKKHCKLFSLAAKRFLNDLERAREPSCHFVFNEDKAHEICAFVELCPHVEGSWSTSTITLEPVQCFILVNVFGFRLKSDTSVRRFNTAYIEMARKNAKSALSGPVALYCLTMEDELGPQIYCAATKLDQAEIVFNVIKGMAENMPEFKDEFSIDPRAKSLICGMNGGVVKPITANAKKHDGFNPHLTILDELHAHEDRSLFDVMRSATGARNNPLSWYITTAGFNIDGVCYDQRVFVERFLKGIIPPEESDHYFGAVFTLDAGDDIFDESNWIKSNPMIGITPKLEKVREHASEAKNSPAAAYDFKTKRCNIWTQEKGAYLNPEKIPTLESEMVFDPSELSNTDVWYGLDLSQTDDVTAFIGVCRYKKGVAMFGKLYLPEGVLKKRNSRAAPYQLWAEQGWITLTPGEVVDYDFVEKDVDKAFSTANFRRLAYDRYNAQALIRSLESKGVPVVEFRQGAQSFNEPMKELKRLTDSGCLYTDGSPVLRWMLANLAARTDSNENVSPCKKASKGKIDGAVGGIMALGAMMNDSSSAAVRLTSIFEDPEYLAALGINPDNPEDDDGNDESY